MRSVLAMMAVAVALVLPCAYPFATASSAQARKPSPISQPQFPADNYHNQPSARHMANVGTSVLDNGTPGSKRKGSIGRFMRFLNGKGSPQDFWKEAEQGASLPSRLFFQYASPLLDLAAQRRLEVEDALYVADQNSMNATVSSLTQLYDDQRDHSRRKLEEQRMKEGTEKAQASQTLLLAKTLLLHQRKTLMWTGFLRLINTGIQAFPSILLARLLRLVEAGESQPASKALGAAISLVGVLMAKMIIENQYFHSVVKCSTEVRGALSGLIFDKSLRLPGGGSGVTHKTDTFDGKQRQALGAGGVLNLMQSDTSIIENAAMQLHTIWDGPLQIAMYSTLLYKYLGPSVFYGIAVLLLAIPLNSFTLRVLNRMSKLENEAKDARTKRTSESISNMKLLKLQGWEQQFADQISEYRRDELKRHADKGVVRALNQAISNSVPALVLVMTLTAYVKTGQPIVASTIFTAISLFNQLRFPLFFYPMLIDSLANGKNAMGRLSSYLSSEEVEPYVELGPVSDEGGSIELCNGNFLWSKPATKEGEVAPPTKPALYDAELKVKPGEVVAVVGPVGSGKSALIKSLLGELVPVPKEVVKQSISSADDASADDASTDTLPQTIFDKPSVRTQGNIAYCSQEAWLPKGTIREAVVFGREYDEERYMAAIRDAGLEGDMVDNLDSDAADSKRLASSGVLSHETQVGESGSSLSGGQRARVALARALYAGEDTKVFLLDDPLAALDASVGSLVLGRLLKRLKSTGSATVLVTNDPNIPRRTDRVVLMEKVPGSSSCSTIASVGTYDELIRRGFSLQSVSEEDLTGDDDDKEPGRSSAFPFESSEIFEDEDIGTNCTSSSDCHADPEYQVALELCPDFISENGLASQQRDETINAEQKSVMLNGRHNQTIETFENKKMTDAPVLATKQLSSTDDAMTSEGVSMDVYKTYFRSVKKPLLIFAMISAYMLSNGAQFYQQFVVAKWTELGRGSSMSAALGSKYLKTLVNAAGVVSVCLWLRSFLTMRVGIRASESLHSQMLRSVFAAPQSFFDATPSGQILTRFGKEMQSVDRAVPDSIGSVLFCFLQIFMSAAALAGVVTPGMLVPLFVVGGMYTSTMRRFRPGARDLKRVETKTRSPIYTQFGEALRGTEIIRSIPGSKLFWSNAHRHMTDTNLRAFYSVKALDRWLSCRLETLGNIVVFTAAMASVYLTRVGRLQAGSAGWGLTQAMAITGLMTWAVRCLTDLESNFLSVVRVKELTDLDSEEGGVEARDTPEESSQRMPKESSAAGTALKSLFQSSPSTADVALAPPNDRAIRGWPWLGSIKFKNVSMRYNPISDLVLKSVDLTVPPGTTLGVVGRTGSGKSSLLLTLFRLVEIEGGGQIEIDGIDIRSISMQKLRESLAIIPQDPVLFAGTVAYNLDATGNASSENMWEALNTASPSLATQFQQSGGLDTPITEGGKNLSLGQRQLLCLARALLRKSKILVLDEATASVDPKTDQEVQATIRREFVDKGVTVMTVAHRLETVLGYDKICVLGDGKVIEYGTPSELLKNDKGELRRLVDADRQSKRKGARSRTEAAIATA